MLNRIEQLGLLSLIEEAVSKEINERQYQIKMAAELRRLTLLYFQGKLSSIIPDGPAVVALRENFKSAEALFLKRISTEWAEHEELVMLAELLNSELVVYTADTKTGQDCRMNLSPTVLGVQREEIELYNSLNVHWSAVVSTHSDPKNKVSVLEGKKVLNTLGDGHCGFNAVSLVVKNKAEEQKAIQSQETILRELKKESKESKETANSQYDAMIHRLEKNAKAGDIKSENILKQIEDDAKLAVKLSLEVGFYSKSTSVNDRKTLQSEFARPFSPTKLSQ